VYTGQITFTTGLCSQDITPSGKEQIQDGCSQGEGKSTQGSEGLSASPPCAVVVEPCSFKSVYCLASRVYLSPLRSDAVINSSFAQVGLTGLCDIAFKDIQSRLDENNIVQELFSPFAAESVIPQLSKAHRANVTPTKSRARQRNGTRVLPV